MAARNSDSWTWHLRVNRLAASPRLDAARRARALRRAGLDVDPGAAVQAGCWFFGADVAVADGAWVSHGCYFDSRGRIEVGEQAYLGYEVMLCTSTHAPGDRTRRAGAFRTAPVVVGAGAWVGARALLLPGVAVAPGAVVAAGAVVTADCAADGLYAGVPARRVKDLD